MKQMLIDFMLAVIAVCLCLGISVFIATHS
jgi:hypothetical protein